jgi:hypothetical protein
MRVENKMKLRYAIAVILWIVVFCIGIYEAFLRYICANPTLYPIDGHPANFCQPPWTTLGTLVVFSGIVLSATLLATLYWKFGFPRGYVSKAGSKDITQE